MDRDSGGAPVAPSAGGSPADDAGRPGQGVGPLSVDSPAFRRLFKRSGSGMLLVSDTRHYVAVNDAACRIFGLAADQILGRRIDEFTAPELRPVLPVLWANFLDGGTQAGVYELMVGRRRIELEFTAIARVGPGQHLFIVLAPVRTGAAGEPPGLLSGLRDFVLTVREREVLALLARGKSADDVALELAIARNTVQNHLRSARAKLGAKTRSHAIVLAIRRGEIALDDATVAGRGTAART